MLFFSRSCQNVRGVPSAGLLGKNRISDGGKQLCQTRLQARARSVSSATRRTLISATSRLIVVVQIGSLAGHAVHCGAVHLCISSSSIVMSRSQRGVGRPRLCRRRSADRNVIVSTFNGDNGGNIPAPPTQPGALALRRSQPFDSTS
ncbi:hypothetical protein EVAR_84555_1 [Eumeta japonica]|uniref:Uncharacterized protein n=1 Tax=Eumeta variegata TaxID=151549 RepID=A0A4C1UHU9_EUMVA|nr:hypothetical protein EVAR_84555_1 [Eumeta japonica]